MRVLRYRPLTTFVLGSILAPALARAQDSSFETVYFAQPNNRILKVVEFQLPNGPGSAEPVLFERGSRFQGLTVRQDNLIFVANTTQQGSILVCDPESGECQRVVGFEKPEGLDISTSTGALVAVGDHEEVLELDPTGCSQTFDSPGCRPGGYRLDVAKRELPAVQAPSSRETSRSCRRHRRSSSSFPTSAPRPPWCSRKSSSTGSGGRPPDSRSIPPAMRSS
jgi:hypothetical protein